MSKELLQLNEKWNSAWLSKDVSAVETYAASDYVYIGPQGQMLDREAILEIIRSPSYRLLNGSWTEVSINRLSTDVTLVLDRFQGNGEYLGQPFEEDHRHTTVWVRRQGKWQVCLEHCSTIAND